jgi:hypothetical protein
MDSLTPPFLSPWQVSGLWLPARKAFSILTNLPRDPRLDFSLAWNRYWQTVCNLVLEVLAEQKILPVLKMHNTLQIGSPSKRAGWLCWTVPAMDPAWHISWLPCTRLPVRDTPRPD